MIKALGWDSLEHRKLINQVFMFYKMYKGLVGISLQRKYQHRDSQPQAGRKARRQVLTLISYALGPQT